MTGGGQHAGSLPLLRLPSRRDYGSSLLQVTYEPVFLTLSLFHVGFDMVQVFLHAVATLRGKWLTVRRRGEVRQGTEFRLMVLHAQINDTAALKTSVGSAFCRQHWVIVLVDMMGT